MSTHKQPYTGSLLTVVSVCMITGLFLYQAQVTVRPTGVKVSVDGVPLAFGYDSEGSEDSSVSDVAGSSDGASSEDDTSASASVAGSSRSSSRGPTCGNGILETGEQCDPPGVGTCDNTCKNATGGGNGGTTGTFPRASSSRAGSLASGQRLPPPVTCGNGIIEPSKGETCDNGRFNGLAPGCSRYCEDKYCGDGIVSPENAEECEPATHSDGSFIAPTCGKGCTVPTCDADSCVLGCNWIFLPQCKASAAPASSKAAVVASSVSRSSVPAVASSSVPAPASSSKPAVASSSKAAVPASSSVVPVETSPSSAPETVVTEEASSQSSSEEQVIEGPSSSSEQALSEVLELPPAACGDGIVQEEAGEQCDDGNDAPGDGCTACAVERGPRARCGDGQVAPWEQCDEGERNADDVPDACRLTCRLAYCGDGVMDAGEQCDDGNDILGDGCTSTCVFSLCGNGVLELGEECDEGRRNSDTAPDACSTLCLMPRCGDGVTDPAFGERCDEGLSNAAEPDRCRPWCAPPRCGDGIEDTGEQCDDGNANLGDGCDASCRTEIAASSSASSDARVPQDVHGAAPLEASVWWWLLPLLLMFTTTAWAVLRYVRSRRL